MNSNAYRAAVSAAAIALLAAAGAAEAKPQPRPDLRVRTLAVVAGSAKPGAAIQVREVTANSGTKRARKIVTSLLLSKDAHADATDVRLGGRKLRRLRAGRASLRARTVLIPKTVAPGAYRLVACADARRHVRESNERNNCTSTPLTVAAAAGSGPGKPPTKKPPVDPQPGPPAYLVISPDTTLTMGVGESKTTSTSFWNQDNVKSIAYSAEAYDSDGNDLGDVTDDVTWKIRPDGACDNGECSATKAGLHYIEVSLGLLATFTSVDVDDPNLFCRGENYDLNGKNADGCEKAQPAPGHTTRDTATSLGAKTCSDGVSDASFKGSLLSDQRIHSTPTVDGFDSNSGAAPEWTRILALGSVGPSCVRDLRMTIQMTGGTSQKCYRLTVLFASDDSSAAYAQYSIDVKGNGSASLTKNGNIYDPGSTVYFQIRKTCASSVHEKADYLVSYHL